MKTRLYIIVKNPLTKRDFERFGLKRLEEKFDLVVLDCTKWLMQRAFESRGHSSIAHPMTRQVRSYGELRKFLDLPGYAMDYVGQFSPRAILLFDLLRRRGIKIVVVDSGSFPIPNEINPNQPVLKKLASVIYHGALTTALNGQLIRLMLRFLPDQNPDIALVSGSSWKSDNRFCLAKKQLQSHSFDCERFLNLREQDLPEEVLKLESFVVYIDERIPEHEDNIELNLPHPATAECFYPSLNSTFEAIEKETGMPVLIAGYPSRECKLQDQFAGRLTVVGMTPELINRCSLVLLHASTAVSFAVISRKPVVFLTSNEISRSWYSKWIDVCRSSLSAPLVSIDTPKILSDWNTFRDESYARYENTHIRNGAKPVNSIWDVLEIAISEDMGTA